MRKRGYDRSMKDVGDLAWLLNGAEDILLQAGNRQQEQLWLTSALKVARRLAERLEKAVL